MEWPWAKSRVDLSPRARVDSHSSTGGSVGKHLNSLWAACQAGVCHSHAASSHPGTPGLALPCSLFTGATPRPGEGAATSSVAQRPEQGGPVPTPVCPPARVHRAPEFPQLGAGLSLLRLLPQFWEGICGSGSGPAAQSSAATGRHTWETCCLESAYGGGASGAGRPRPALRGVALPRPDCSPGKTLKGLNQAHHIV